MVVLETNFQCWTSNGACFPPEFEARSSKGAVFFNPRGGAGASFRNSNFFSQPPPKIQKILIAPLEIQKKIIAPPKNQKIFEAPP